MTTRCTPVTRWFPLRGMYVSRRHTLELYEAGWDIGWGKARQSCLAFTRRKARGAPYP